MNADDDGFVQLKSIMRTASATEEDARLLLDRGLLIVFPDGVVVIRDWLIHNEIRQDRYKQTFYIEHKNKLQIMDTRQYNLVLPNDNQMDTQVRLGKDRIGKVKLSKDNIRERENAHTQLEKVSFKSRKEITDTTLQEIADNFSVPLPFVRDCWDSAQNWCDAKGKVMQNYKAFLSNWVKRERVDFMLKVKKYGNIPRVADFTNL
jgi:hypothetical protein